MLKMRLVALAPSLFLPTGCGDRFGTATITARGEGAVGPAEEAALPADEPPEEVLWAARGPCNRKPPRQGPWALISFTVGPVNTALRSIL